MHKKSFGTILNKARCKKNPKGKTKKSWIDKIDLFLTQIATGDEKCVNYDNIT